MSIGLPEQVQIGSSFAVPGLGEQTWSFPFVGASLSTSRGPELVFSLLSPTNNMRISVEGGDTDVGPWFRMLEISAAAGALTHAQSRVPAAPFVMIRLQNLAAGASTGRFQMAELPIRARG